MKPSAVDAVVRGLTKADVSVVCCLPDSLQDLHPFLDADPAIRSDASPTRALPDSIVAGAAGTRGQRVSSEGRLVFVRHVAALEGMTIPGASERN